MKNILVRPLITEKMTAESEKFNRYGFIVNEKANKIEIRNAVESEYGVKVTEVRTMNYDGKLKTRMTKTGIQTGRSASFKKAIVQLADGDIIDFYETI